MSIAHDEIERPGAGCGAAIHNEAGALLLIARLKPPEAGAWGLPGGKIDFGERAEAATVREIGEELGIKIQLTGLACLTQTLNAGDGQHWVAPVYSARIISGEPRILEPTKHSDWGWFALDEMPERLTTPTRQYLAELG